MAKTHISFLVLLFSSLQIHARVLSPSPSPAPEEAVAENGYGLYGRDSSQYDTTNDENGTPSDGVGGDKYPNYNTGYTNTNAEGLTGQSLMSTNYNGNNDVNGDAYGAEWSQPEKESDNGSSDGYKMENFKYEFESMEEYDKYRRTKGRYWP